MLPVQQVSDKAASTALLVHLVVEEILSNLPLNDLLRLSLVSKIWSCACRGIIRNERKCLLDLKLRNVALEELLTILENSANVPFNGVAIQIDQHGTVPRDFERACESAASKFRLRHLKMLVQETLTQNSDELNIFLKMACNLKTLEIQGHLHPSTFDNLYFPSLTSVTLSKDISGEVLHHLLRSAPKLRKVFGELSPSALEYLTNINAVPLVQDFHLKSSASTDYLNDLTLCYDFALQCPKLRRLVVRFDHFEDLESVIVFRNVLQLLLQSSAYSLQIIEIDQLSLYWLTRLDIPPMSSVHSLRFGYDEDLDVILQTVSLLRIDFGYLFPHLRNVDICREYSLYLGLSQERLFEIAFDDFLHFQPTPCYHVRNVSLHRTLLTQTQMELITQIFPAI